MHNCSYIYEVLPLQKRGGGGKSFSCAEVGGGGGTKGFEVVLTWELEVLAIVIWGGGRGRKKFPPHAPCVYMKVH